MKVIPIILALVRHSDYIPVSLGKLAVKGDRKTWRGLWHQLSQLQLDDLDQIHSFAMLGATNLTFSKELTFGLAGLINACFDESAGPNLRSRYEMQFRNRMNEAIIEFLVVDRSTLELDQLFDELALQLSGPNRDEVIDAPLSRILKMQLSSVYGDLMNLHPSRTQTWWGIFSAPRLPLYEFICESFETPTLSPKDLAELRNWCRLARSAAAYSFYSRFCLVCDRPTERTNDESGSSQ